MNGIANHPIEPVQDEIAQLRQRIAELENELSSQQLETEIADLQMLRAYNFLLSIYNVVPGLMLVVDDRGVIRQANAEAGRILGCNEQTLRGHLLTDFMAGAKAEVQALLQNPDHPAIRREVEFNTVAGDYFPVLLSMRATRSDKVDRVLLVVMGLDLRERKQLELSLRHAQKLESVGQLTAGIAHEINTPMQYIVDHMGFVEEGLTHLIELVQFANKIILPTQEKAWQLEKSAADFDFFASRVPKAIGRINDGVGRVIDIVSGMRAFAHPGVRHEMSDLNALLESSLLLASSLYRNVAKIDRFLMPLPQVPCIPGDIGQVLVNLVSNASHAIREFYGDQEQGVIRLKTGVCDDGESVYLICEDNAGGVPASVQHRIFDPFFTTKRVGEGSGQGLSICQNIICTRHQGTIRFEPVLPHGARFIITLPLG